MTLDGDGQILSVAVSEPRFSPVDVDVMLASRREERRPRGRHGHLLEEATDPAYQYDWEAPLPTMDFAQAAIDRAQDKYKKAYPEANMDALLWEVHRK